MKQKCTIFAALLFCMSTFLVGCDTKDSQNEIDHVSKQLSEVFDMAKAKATKYAPETTNATMAEMEKFMSVEYRVVDIKSSLSAEDFQLRMNQLGKDRWDCFHIEKNEELTRLFCKRRPQSYLRYILPGVGEILQ